jgi:putative ABC transport system permease protein
MGIPLLRGRLFDTSDTLGAHEAIVVSQSFARRLFRDGNPVGQRIRIGPETGSDRPWDVIVGVVGDVKQQSLAVDETAAFYVTSDQWLWIDDAHWLVVRASADATALPAAIRQAIWSVDEDRSIQHVTTMAAVVASSAAQRRFALIVIESCALAALVLAALGIYGVMSATVRERTRDIGIQKALGASAARISVQILRTGLLTAATGVVLGALAAVAASRSLETLLFRVSPLDAATYAAVCALLAVIAVLASSAPAWRAARIDPAITLRTE